MDVEDDLVQAGRLKAAVKSYRRKGRTREIVLWVALVGSLWVPIEGQYSRTEWLVWLLGMFVVVFFEQLAKHIRAIQLRLARMADTLDQVAGKEPQDHLLLELSEA